jgi:hypothetical protein
VPALLWRNGLAGFYVVATTWATPSDVDRRVVPMEGSTCYAIKFQQPAVTRSDLVTVPLRSRNARPRLLP